MDGDADVAPFSGASQTQSQTLGLHGSWFNPAGSHVDAILQFGRLDLEAQRNVRLAAMGWVTEGSSEGRRLTMHLGAGHPFELGRFVVEPLGWLEWTNLDLDGFEEEGAGALNLEVSQRQVRSLRSEVGIRVSGRFALAGGRVPLVPELQLGWAREWLSDAALEAGLAGGSVSPFQVRTLASDGDTFVLRARSTVHLTERFSISAGVSSELGRDDLATTQLQIGAAFAF